MKRPENVPLPRESPCSIYEKSWRLLLTPTSVWIDELPYRVPIAKKHLQQPIPICPEWESNALPSISVKATPHITTLRDCQVKYNKSVYNTFY